MQKKILAAAVAALCGVTTTATVAQTNESKVQLWGIVDAALRHTNNEGANQGSLTKMIGGGMSQSRFGINAEEDLGNGYKTLVVLENRFTSDDGNTTPVTPAFFQLSYVGLRTPYGQLTMGRQYNVLFDVVTSTYSSFPYSPYMEAYKPELGLAMGARNSNALKYAFASADRTWVGSLQYSFAEGNNTKAVNAAAVELAETKGYGAALPVALNSTYKGVVDGLVSNINPSAPDPDAADLVKKATAVGGGSLKSAGGFLRYSKNGVSVGGGYLRTDLPGKTKVDAWTFGGSYRKDKIYVNLGYGVNKVKRPVWSGGTVQQYIEHKASLFVDQNVLEAFWQGQTNGGFQAGDSNKRQMYKMGFGYQVTSQINAGLHYYHAKQSGSDSGASDGKANFLVGVIDYAFSKRTDAYFAVDHTKVSGGSAMYLDKTSLARSRTGITVGLRHRF